MNKWLISGNLTKDPEQRTVGENTVTTFTLAVSSGYGDKKKTEFPRISVWGARGNPVMRFCHKGSKLIIVGELSTNEYTGRDNQKYWNLEVRADEVEIIFDNKTNAGADAQSRIKPASAEIPSNNDDDDDELPF